MAAGLALACCGGAVQHGDAWIVFVDPKVAALVGLGDVLLTPLDAINADHALRWVNLLAALYVKAVGQ